MRSILALFSLVVPLLASSEHAPAASGAVRITTITPEYCATLYERLAGLPGAEAEAPRVMAEEGRRLCAEGQVRVGIAWLRRALRIASGLE
ncbi:hypothetical protein [Roseococcus suduntuyensis]|uniref:hypothetical protein n=1 Tax=Roseococcus suduntuyensis TaxID=455361 RepID=UPI0016074A56|nr:hypothetical protein [Roseococcus suduntuyensis]